MRNKRYGNTAVTALILAVLWYSLNGLFIPSQLYALTNDPELLITEVVPASSGSNQAYEYVEIYNDTSHEINLDHYRLRYYSASPYTTFANEWTLLNKTIQPRSAMVLWLQKLDNLNSPTGPNALADFNGNYGVQLTDRPGLPCQADDKRTGPA
ncbi:lamin tail domain-containing protein [Paenibacillus sp. TAB 01]|uniref:lamin tail domain-containing protein n=1 Tax=Paenibacillus sp. TAB 01 TaxID=3368988 RepID=UPI003753353B